MIRVLFVCLGNICRSPMAEFVMKKEVADRGIEHDFYIASAGISDEEAGNPVYPPARAVLSAHGIECGGKRAKQFTSSDYASFDYILCMEEWHVRRIVQRCGDPAHKVFLLSGFTPSPHDIADPWYTRDFETAYEDILASVNAFLLHLQEEGRRK